MARGPVSDGALVTQTKHQRIAARAEAAKQIAALLAIEPMTIAEIVAELGMSRSTIFSYMRHMHEKLLTIRKLDESRDGSLLWTTGPDPAIQAKDEEFDKRMVEKRYAVQAHQIGMQRDYLVAALFGPATPQL